MATSPKNTCIKNKTYQFKDKKRKIDRSRRNSTTLLGVGVAGDVVNSVSGGVDLLELGVGDLNEELVLESHDKLDGVERVKTKILGEVSSVADLIGVNLGEVLHNLEDAVLDNIGGEVSRVSGTSHVTGLGNEHRGKLLRAHGSAGGEGAGRKGRNTGDETRKHSDKRRGDTDQE